MSPHPNIHKYTPMSPDVEMHNQIVAFSFTPVKICRAFLVIFAPCSAMV